jgi:hypothetical protein
MKSKSGQRFKFQYYVTRGVDSGINVDLFADSEKLARAKLKKLLEGDFSTQLQKVEECLP